MFRLSGSLTALEKLKTQFDRGWLVVVRIFCSHLLSVGEDVRFTGPDPVEVNVVSALIKAFLRELQEPLTMYELFGKIIRIAGL